MCLEQTTEVDVALSLEAYRGCCQWLCVILEKTFLSLTTKASRGECYSRAIPVRCDRTEGLQARSPLIYRSHKSKDFYLIGEKEMI